MLPRGVAWLGAFWLWGSWTWVWILFYRLLAIWPWTSASLLWASVSLFVTWGQKSLPWWIADFWCHYLEWLDSQAHVQKKISLVEGRRKRDTGIIPLIKNPKSQSSWVPFPIIEMEKWRLREGKALAQNHTVSENPGLLSPRVHLSASVTS